MRGDGDQNSMSALRRLARALGDWRQRRAARRRAGPYSFMALSDRVLADIGVRRADVVGAVLRAMPLRRTAADVLEPPCDAGICQLPRRPRLTVVADLDAAA